MVFVRGDPSAGTGHVAFFDHQDGDRIFVLGGNQADAVNIAAFSRKSVLAYRMPVETAPLPTDTTLPTILTIDPANAPPHVLGIGAAAAATTGPREARATEVLSQGASGPQVLALQQALAAAAFQPGEIDGEYGPRTASAVSNFQSAKRLPVTGIADADTMRSLGLVVAPVVPLPLPFDRGVIPADGGGIMPPQDLLKTVIDALVKNQSAASPVSAAPAATGVDTSQLLQIVLGALTGKPGAASPTGTTPPVMSPIDKMLGGEALMGKKTPLAILAYVIMAIVQAVEPGMAGGTGSTVLTTLIGAFGGLGVLSKVDRVVQMLGIIAAKPK